MLLFSVGWALLSCALSKPAGVESCWVWKPHLLFHTKTVLHPPVIHPDFYSHFSLACPKKSPHIFALRLRPILWFTAAPHPDGCQQCRCWVPSASFQPRNHKIMEWFGLEGTSKTIWFQHSCHGQAHLPLDQLLRNLCRLTMNIFRNGAGIILLSYSKTL